MAVDPVVTHLSDKPRADKAATSLRLNPADVTSVQGPFEMKPKTADVKQTTSAVQPEGWVSPGPTGRQARDCNVPLCQGGGWVPEGEPVCTDDYIDTYNSGCNHALQAFLPIDCNDMICGESGTYLYKGSEYRDTDWYEINVPVDTRITVTFRAEFAGAVGFIEAASVGCPDCDTNTGYISPYAAPEACEEVTLSACVPGQVICDPNNPTPQNGVYWIFVSTQEFSGVPCGSDSEYELSITCEPCTFEQCPPTTTLTGQRPHSDAEAGDAVVRVSNSQFYYDYGDGGGIKVLESAVGISADVVDLHWWGLSLVYDDEFNLVKCDPNNCTNFVIEFWPFDPMTHRPPLPDPNEILVSYNVTVTPTETDLDYWGELGPVLEWSVNLPYTWFDPQNLKFWMAIQNTDPCMFWWHSGVAPQLGVTLTLDERTGKWEEETGDSAYCVTGTPNPNYTGACCRADEYTPPECFDGVYVEDCMGLGEFFFPGLQCSNIPDEDCNSLPTAACCDLQGDCFDDTNYWYCILGGGNWYEGESCYTIPPFPCPIPDECGLECTGSPAIAQNCASSGYVYPSHTLSMGPRFFDNYTVASPITKLGWWGMDATGDAPEGYNDGCDFEDPCPFVIRFYPGAVPNGPPQMDTITWEDTLYCFFCTTSWYVGEYGQIKYWSTPLPSVAQLSGWFSVQSENNLIQQDEGDTCVFWSWEGVGDGYNWFWGSSGLEQVGNGSSPAADNSWCMYTGIITGACCHLDTGTCEYPVAESDCLGPEVQFYATLQDCNDMCEPVPGACCDRVTGGCRITTLADCNGTNEEFIGIRTDCTECCVPPCDSKAVPEGEPTCTDEYVDTYNSGCGAAPAAELYQQINSTDVICGETGLFQRGGQGYRDTDWYKFTVPFGGSQVKAVHLHVQGEFLQQTMLITDCAGISQARGDCNGDGSINGLDIDPFVAALVNPDQFNVDYDGTVQWECVADVNCDGSMNGLDIDPFVSCLTVGCLGCDCDQVFWTFPPSHMGDAGKCWPGYPALVVPESTDKLQHMLAFVSTYSDEDPDPECGTAYKAWITHPAAGACTIGGECALRTQAVCVALGGTFQAGQSCP
jgi:hypothetical protein